MSAFPPSLDAVIEAFTKLPGLGKKTAQRLGFHLLKMDKDYIVNMAAALIDLKEKIKFCDLCHGLAEDSVCAICSDAHRDHQLICVVEEPADIFIFERTGFRGVYHVLGGVLSPLDGISPGDLHIRDLVKRSKEAREVVIAINAGIEGETTTLYLSKLLENSETAVTRLARGLPVGGNLDYVDDLTLSRSLSERVNVLNG